MVAAKLVFPGPFLDGKSLYDLFEAEGVTLSAGVPTVWQGLVAAGEGNNLAFAAGGATMSAGVPTVWQGLLAHVEANNLAFATMRRTIIGGAACPPAMMRTFQERCEVQVLHAWGMTELSPVGTV